MICFAWMELPQYAARLIEAFRQSTSESVIVITTPVRVPVRGMATILKCPIITQQTLSEPVLARLPEIPRVLFTSNWHAPAWREVEEAVREAGGHVIADVDSNDVCSFKRMLRELYFRICLRKRFVGYFVPGISGQRLLQRYGVPVDRIQQGCLAADATLFTAGEPLSVRPKRLLYVGQFIQRKNVVRLVKAFKAFHAQAPDWTLQMIGSGPLEHALQGHPGIEVIPFVQPEQLGGYFRQARGFILPSYAEPWGLVVQEAALSGCFLLLSKQIGAAADFATPDNARLFSPYCTRAIQRTLRNFAQLSETSLDRAYHCSLDRGQHFSLDTFVHAVKRLAGNVMMKRDNNIKGGE